MCRNGVAVEMSFDHKPEDEVHLCKLKTIAKKINIENIRTAAYLPNIIPLMIRWS